MNDDPKKLDGGEASCAPALPPEQLKPSEDGDGWDTAKELPTGEVASAIPPEELERMTDDMIAALKSVYDPEIPVDIFELGLIYKIDIDDDRNVDIDMTLTAPGCPVAGEMPGWLADAVSAVPGVKQVDVDLVWEPPWGMEMMSDEARLELGFM